MLSEGDRKLLKEQKELDFSYAFEDKSRFRVKRFTQRGYLWSPLRLISNKAKTVKELNLPAILSDFAKKNKVFSWLSVLLGMANQRLWRQWLKK